MERPMSDEYQNEARRLLEERFGGGMPLSKLHPTVQPSAYQAMREIAAAKREVAQLQAWNKELVMVVNLAAVENLGDTEMQRVIKQMANAALTVSPEAK